MIWEDEIAAWLSGDVGDEDCNGIHGELGLEARQESEEEEAGGRRSTAQRRVTLDSEVARAIRRSEPCQCRVAYVRYDRGNSSVTSASLFISTFYRSPLISPREE